MTAPLAFTLVCPGCGSADVHVVEVSADGESLIRCGNPNCTRRPWQVPGPPELLPELRGLGAVLAGQQRAVRSLSAGASTPVRRARLARARDAAVEAELAIIDLLREQVAA